MADQLDTILRRVLLADALLLAAACGNDDQSATTDSTEAPTTTVEPTTTTEARSDRPTSVAACQELRELVEESADGQVYVIEMPGRLEEVQDIAEVDGDAYLYAALDDAIDGYDLRNLDSDAAMETVGDVLLSCTGALAGP